MFFLLSLSNLYAIPYLEGEITGYHTPTITLDNDGTSSQQSSWMRTRFFLGETFSPSKNWRINTRLEFANAQLLGDYSTLGLDVADDIFRVQRSDNSDLMYVMPRDLSITYKNEEWGFNIGIQSFMWGLGILSHDGNRNSRFGATQQGNTYARAGIFSVPSQKNAGVMFLGAADIIIRDENAFLYLIH